MVGDGFEVDAEELAGHARQLSRLADELRAAFDTAQQVNMTTDAYGEPGRRFASMLDRLGQSGQGTLRAGAEAIDFADRQLRDTATAYIATDATSATVFGGETDEGLSV